MPNPNSADDYEVTYTNWTDGTAPLQGTYTYINGVGDIVNAMDYSPQIELVGDTFENAGFSYVFDPDENSWVIRENLYKPPTLTERYKRRDNKEFGIAKFMRGENV